MENRGFLFLAAFVCVVTALVDRECPECGCMQWTNWINSDKPTAVGDFETLRFGKPGYGSYITDPNGKPGNVAKKLWTDYKMTCNHPIEIECRDAVTHQPFFQTGDFTIFPKSVKCTTDQGLICVNADQQNRQCRDYEVRLLCWTPCRTLQWTLWSNRDRPSGNGDYEGHQMADHSVRNYEPCRTGSSPYDIECRRAGVGTSALVAGQKNLMCDRNWGFVCINADNSPSCYDYEVRYLCRV